MYWRVRVCERFVTYLQRRCVTAGVPSSSPSSPTLPRREDGVSPGSREISCQESQPQNYHMGPSPNKTLQHVCGNEDLCFCVRAICQWPPPTSLLTWLSLSPLLMFGCFLFFLSPPRCILEGNAEKKRGIPHPLYPEDPC